MLLDIDADEAQGALAFRKLTEWGILLPTPLKEWQRDYTEEKDIICLSQPTILPGVDENLKMKEDRLESLSEDILPSHIHFSQAEFREIFLTVRGRGGMGVDG